METPLTIKQNARYRLHYKSSGREGEIMTLKMGVFDGERALGSSDLLQILVSYQTERGEPLHDVKVEVYERQNLLEEQRR